MRQEQLEDSAFRGRKCAAQGVPLRGIDFISEPFDRCCGQGLRID